MGIAGAKALTPALLVLLAESRRSAVSPFSDPAVERVIEAQNGK